MKQVNLPFWELIKRSLSHLCPQVLLTASAFNLFFGLVTTQHKMRSRFNGVADGVVTEVVTIVVVVAGVGVVVTSVMLCLT
jgi:hypothetical protein